MKIKKIIATIVSVVIVLELMPMTLALTLETEDISTSPTDFALQQVIAISENDPSSPWTSQTVISGSIVLFGMDETPSGYVFKLKTSDIDSGFIQIHDIDGQYSLYSYSYSGDSEVECMAQYWNIELSSVPKLYFINCLTYLLKNAAGEYYDLATNTLSTCNKNELSTIERNYSAKVSAAPLVAEIDRLPAKSKISAQRVAVPMGSDDDFTWPIMSDFSGMTITYNGKTQNVHDHCTPTAATAIVRCLRHLGKTQCSAGETTRQTFTNMYTSLNTNQIRFDNPSSSGSGTYRPGIAGGIITYATLSGKTITANKALITTLTGMKSHLDSGRLLLVSVDGFNGGSNHSIVATGYSSDTLFIQNGWSRSRVMYSYSSLDIAQYVYVGG